MNQGRGETFPLSKALADCHVAPHNEAARWASTMPAIPCGVEHVIPPYIRRMVYCTREGAREYRRAYSEVCMIIFAGTRRLY